MHWQLINSNLLVDTCKAVSIQFRNKIFYLYIRHFHLLKIYFKNHIFANKNLLSKSLIFCVRG